MTNLSFVRTELEPGDEEYNATESGENVYEEQLEGQGEGEDAWVCVAVRRYLV